MLTGRRVFVAGHRGMVGSALTRVLAARGCTLVAAPREELDLRRQADVEAWLSRHRPEVVIIAAAQVGGILANASKPVDFLYDNLMIQSNLIQGSHGAGVQKLLFLGSSCIYPREAPQPITEDSLLSGPLEPTNQWYAVAKIAGIKLCQAFRQQHGADFIAAMPCNLYGPGDNFDEHTSHVVPAMIRRFIAAKREDAPAVTCWGSGTPRREFLYVDDLAEACVLLLERYAGADPINVGTGTDISIAELADQVKRATEFTGRVSWDRSKPDGTPNKLMDVSRVTTLGWHARTPFEVGLRRSIAWYSEQVAT